MDIRRPQRPDFLAGKPSGTFLAFLFFVVEAG
jgi:hypothetical protein